jgi:hypothetical protein
MYTTSTLPALVRACVTPLLSYPDPSSFILISVRTGNAFDVCETRVQELQDWKIDPCQVYTIYLRPMTSRVVLCAVREANITQWHSVCTNMNFATSGAM